MTIRELAEAVMHVINFQGGLKFDESKPDGTSRKLMDVIGMTGLGWKVKTSL